MINAYFHGILPSGKILETTERYALVGPRQTCILVSIDPGSQQLRMDYIPLWKVGLAHCFDFTESKHHNAALTKLHLHVHACKVTLSVIAFHSNNEFEWRSNH